MTFSNSDLPIDETHVMDCETDCRIVFPRSLREAYLSSNGGEPDPYVLQTEDIDTVVSEFLPLVSQSRGTAVECYKRLVSELGIVPPNFFPFAVDGGGDYFFVDTESSEGKVYFFRSDQADDSPLLELGLTLDEFWGALRPE